MKLCTLSTYNAEFKKCQPVVKQDKDRYYSKYEKVVQNKALVNNEFCIAVVERHKYIYSQVTNSIDGYRTVYMLFDIASLTV